MILKERRENMRKNLTKNNGFSLTELIIVVAVMVILAAVVAPVLYRYIDKSRKADDVESAGVIAKAMNVALSDEEAYDAVMASANSPDGKAQILLMAKNGDTEWTRSAGVDPNGCLKKIMDTVCPPPTVKFKREIDPATSGSTNADYAAGTDEFEPDGWAICLVKNQPCVLITDGTTDPAGVPKGAALSPMLCADYN
jgi:prepilin-type N-terminal cleavage/methylation domain-containing protein